MQDHYRLENPTGNWLGSLMILLDRIARPLERLIPKIFIRSAINKALEFVIERLNGEDGLGGIFPAMANAIMVFEALDYPKDDPKVVNARKAMDNLLVLNEDEGYCQPCLSPVWDTGLAAQAILETSTNGTPDTIRKSLEWLRDTGRRPRRCEEIQSLIAADSNRT